MKAAEKNATIATMLRLKLPVALALLALTSPLAAETVEYGLTKQYGSVFFRVFHQQYLTLVGRFDDYAATLLLDSEDLEQSSLNASVNMASLDMADGDVTETLVNSSVWFNTGIYPEATFTSSSAELLGENELAFHGQLEFVGVSKPWTFQVTLHGGSDGKLEGSTIGISGHGSINRLDFGLDQYRNMAADEVEIEVNAKFNRK